MAPNDKSSINLNPLRALAWVGAADDDKNDGNLVIIKNTWNNQTYLEIKSPKTETNKRLAMFYGPTVNGQQWT